MKPLTREQRLVLTTTAKTLRQVAWADYEGIGDLPGTAESVEQSDAESLTWVCPVCEEVICDDGCPLEALRAGLAESPTDEAA